MNGANMVTTAMVAALIGTGLFFGLRSESVAADAGGPQLAELDSLSRYLDPVAPAPDIESYDMYLPASGPDPIYLPPIDAASEPPRPRRLSAIMLIGDRPLAIIDDQQVVAGSVLPGGTEVVRIEGTEVLLREQNGREHTLQLSGN